MANDNNITIEDLAGMVGKGFDVVDLRLDKIDQKLERIEVKLENIVHPVKCCFAAISQSEII